MTKTKKNAQPLTSQLPATGSEAEILKLHSRQQRRQAPREPVNAIEANDPMRSSAEAAVTAIPKPRASRRKTFRFCPCCGADLPQVLFNMSVALLRTRSLEELNAIIRDPDQRALKTAAQIVIDELIAAKPREKPDNA